MDIKVSEGDRHEMFARVLVVLGLFFLALRFFNMYYPSEYNGDEIRELRDGIYRAEKIYPFFTYNENHENYELHDAANGNLFFQLISVFTPLIKDKIELYRIISISMGIMEVAGIYFLGMMLFNRFVGAASFFMASLSFWMFFSSRIVLSNGMSALFTVFFLAFFLKAMKDKSYMIPSLIFLVIGSNTYVNWILALPPALYILFEAYRGRQISKREFWLYGMLTVIISSGLIVFYFLNTSMFSRPARMFAAEGMANSGIIKPWNILKLFIFSGTSPTLFLQFKPYLTPAETIIFSYGMFLVLGRLRQSSYRILLVCLLSFLMPIFFLDDPHQLRIVQAPIAVYIISGLAFYEAYTLRKYMAAVLAVPVLCCFAWYLGDYYVNWEKALYNEMVNKSMAVYLNETLGNKVVYLEDYEYKYMEIPSRTTLRMKAFYANTPKSSEAFKIDAFWDGKFSASLKPGSFTLKRYLSSVPAPFTRFPVDLVVVDTASDFGKKMASFGGVIRSIKEKAYSSDCGKSVAFINSFFSRSQNSAFFNTILKDIRSDIYMSENRYKEAVDSYLDVTYPSWVTGDFYFRISSLYGMMGDQAKAGLYKSKFSAEKKALGL